MNNNILKIIKNNKLAFTTIIALLFTILILNPVILVMLSKLTKFLISKFYGVTVYLLKSHSFLCFRYNILCIVLFLLFIYLISKNHVKPLFQLKNPSCKKNFEKDLNNGKSTDNKKKTEISTAVYALISAIFGLILIIITPLNFLGLHRSTLFNAITFVLGLFTIPLTLGIVIFALIQANNHIVEGKKNSKHFLSFFMLMTLIFFGYFSFAIIACLNEILLIAKLLRYVVIRTPNYTEEKISEMFAPATAIFAFYTTFIIYIAKKFFEPYLDKNIKKKPLTNYTYSIEELQQLEMLNSMKFQPKHSIDDKSALSAEEIEEQINKIKEKASIKKNG